MTEETYNNQEDELNLGSLSDDEILNLDPSLFEAAPKEESDELDTELANAPLPDIEKTNEETEEEEKEPEQDESTEEQEETAENETDQDESESEKPGNTDSESEQESNNTEEENEAGKESTKETDEIDYKAEYERLTGKFKANGTEMNVNSVDEAIKLMQKGANYTKSMQENANALKLAKVLENNGIDQTALNLLVDVHNKNPEAINQLIKDSGIDVLDIDPESKEQYTPTDYSIPDSQMTLDSVISEIKHSEHYPKLTQYVTGSLDDASKAILRDNPEALAQLHRQMELGVFDVIANEVERRSILGTLTGLTGLEAYRKIGEELHSQKAFDHLLNPNTGNSTDSGKESTAAKRVIPAETDQDKASKRKAAAGGKKPTAKAKTDLSKTNPLNMSDADFEKHFAEAIP